MVFIMLVVRGCVMMNEGVCVLCIDLNDNDDQVDSECVDRNVFTV